MDRIIAFYIIIIAAINIVAILFLLSFAVALAFRYIKEKWWLVIIPILTLVAIPLCARAVSFYIPILTLVAIPLCARAVSFYISLLAEVGVLP